MPLTNRISLLHGNDFQDFCSVLLSAIDPAFQATNGRGGDRGNDGYVIAGGVVYQAWGPDRIELARMRSKVSETLKRITASPLPDGHAATKLVFLTPQDLTVEQHEYLQASCKSNGIEAEAWGHSRLLYQLTQHPQIASQFPDLVLPDMHQMANDLRTLLHAGSRDQLLAKPRPDIYVLQKHDNPELQPHPAHRYFKLTVTAVGLARNGFEPEAEDTLLDWVREYFDDSRSADFEDDARTSTVVAVEHRDPDLAFHMRWRWFASGHFAMAGTLSDLRRPGMYSAADLAVQMARMLQVASLLGEGEAQVTFEIEPHHLKVAFDPSDMRARERLSARLDGIDKVPRPQRTGETRYVVKQQLCLLEAMRGGGHLVAGELLVLALKDLHAARIHTDKFQASILDLIDKCTRAKAL